MRFAAFEPKCHTGHLQPCSDRRLGRTIRLEWLARPEGFEPPTTWFVARYSIQLSYGRFDCLLLFVACIATVNNLCRGSISSVDALAERYIIRVPSTRVNRLSRTDVDLASKPIPNCVACTRHADWLAHTATSNLVLPTGASRTGGRKLGVAVLRRSSSAGRTLDSKRWIVAATVSRDFASHLPRSAAQKRFRRYFQ